MFPGEHRSLLRSFQPRLARTRVVGSHLEQECGGAPTVGSTSGVSSRSYSSSLYAVTPRSNPAFLRRNVGLLFVCAENQYEIPK